jgi:DsbE subfamily thiol:disulfide oxidoreductase
LSARRRGEPGDPRQRARAPRGLLIAAAIAAILFVAVMALALPRLGSSGASPPAALGAADFAARLVAEDRPAPRFDLPALEGPGSISLRSFAGSIVVVNIWASWCPPCREEAPQLERVWTRYRSRGVRFIGVDHEDTRTGGLSFVREFGITYPIGFDPGGSVAASYGAVGVPTTFVIDPDGRIAYRFLGKTTAPMLAATLDRLLAPSG